MNRGHLARILAILLFIVNGLLVREVIVESQSAARVHGIVQDENYQPVNGGDVWLERKWGSGWIEAPCCMNKPMQGHAFGFDVPRPGRYRVMYKKAGYVVEWIRYEEFDLASPPTTDIQINVKREVMPTPTATPAVALTATPTADPTLTATATPTPRPTATANPAVSYIEISPHIQGTLMAYTDLMLQEFTPASCFEIAAAEKGCPLAVTQSWVAQVDGECWKFRPFSCPGSDGIELAARCAAPCEVAVIEDGYW